MTSKTSNNLTDRVTRLEDKYCYISKSLDDLKNNELKRVQEEVSKINELVTNLRIDLKDTAARLAIIVSLIIVGGQLIISELVKRI